MHNTTKRILFLLAALVLVAMPVTASAAPALSRLAYIQPTPIKVPINYNSSVSPIAVETANDHGCNDYWAVFQGFYSVASGTWATNLVNQAHILLHNGLDGYYTCTDGGQCTTKLCTKNDTGADAWSVRIAW